MSGRHLSRVHVIPGVLTPYLRFELECYAGSVEACEDVRLLPPSAFTRSACRRATSGCLTVS